MKRIPAPAELRRPAIVNLAHGVVGGEVGDDGLRRELVGAGPALRLAQPQHRHAQQSGLCKLPRDKLRKVAAELGGGRVGLRVRSPTPALAVRSPTRPQPSSTARLESRALKRSIVESSTTRPTRACADAHSRLYVSRVQRSSQSKSCVDAPLDR